MIVERLRGRTSQIRRRHPETLDRIDDKISDVFPYCYVESENAYLVDCSAKHEGFKGVYGEDLTKCIFADPFDVGQLKKSMNTWEANIPFVNRVLSDKMTEYPDYKHRIWYLDMEWSSMSNEITAITVFDSYTERLYTWFLCNDSWPQAGPVSRMPCVNHPEGMKFVEFDTPAMAFKTEKEMLQHYVKHMRKQDPDVVAGWYVAGADIRVLAERLDHWGIGAKSLSPMNRHRYEYQDDWSQPIPGINTIDLMAAWTKLLSLIHISAPPRLGMIS